MLKWNEGLATGIPEIDAEHKMLFSHLNALYSMARRGIDDDALGKVLADLTEYTMFHFEHEARLMREFGYPDMQSHLREHEGIKKIVEAYDLFHEKHGDIAVVTNLLSFVQKWIVNHIEETDRTLAEYLKQCGK